MGGARSASVLRGPALLLTPGRSIRRGSAGVVPNDDDLNEIAAKIDLLLCEQRRGPGISEEHGLPASLASKHADPRDPMPDVRAAARRAIHPAQSVVWCS
jgi:hypothetical protein